MSKRYPDDLTPPTHPGFRNVDPYLDLAAIRCIRCKQVTGYANAKSPTRTIKQVCSVGCGADQFQSPIRIVEG